MNHEIKSKYPAVISARVTQKEKQAFDELAIAQDLTKSELLRKKIKRSLINNKLS